MKKLLIGLVCILSIAFAGNNRVLIKVEGMTCSLCVTSINQALRKTEGVIKAKASLKTESVEVIVPEGFDKQKLLEAISKTGYQGTIQENITLPTE